MNFAGILEFVRYGISWGDGHGVSFDGYVGMAVGRPFRIGVEEERVAESDGCVGFRECVRLDPFDSFGDCFRTVLE